VENWLVTGNLSDVTEWRSPVALHFSPILTFKPFRQSPFSCLDEQQHFAVKLGYPRKTIPLFYGRNEAVDDVTKTMCVILNGSGFLENAVRTPPSSVL